MSADSERPQEVAHRLAHAVDTDGPAIANLTSIDAQAREDRRVALQPSTEDPDLEAPPAPPPYEEAEPINPLIQQYLQQSRQWDTSSVFEDEVGTHITEDGEEEEHYGLSQAMRYANWKRQEEAPKTLNSEDSVCCSCRSNFRPCDIVLLQCHHKFCRECLKRVFMSSMQDKGLFPPKCCRQDIPLELIKSHLSAEELDDFKNTEAEVSCTVKTYCSNASCGRFIPPSQITADRAHGPRCDSSTCIISCKNGFHEDDCPKDQLLQATMSLAADLKWQPGRCFACRALGVLVTGCNRIRQVRFRLPYLNNH